MMDVQRVEQALIGVLRGIGAIKAVYTATDDPAGRTWPVAVVSLQSVSPSGDVDEADFGVAILMPLEGRMPHASWSGLMTAAQAVVDALDADPMLGGLAVWATTSRADTELVPTEVQPELARMNLVVRVAARDWSLPPEDAGGPVEALRQWARGRWGSQIQDDPATWAPSNDAPGLFWRVAATQATELTAWGAWVDAEVQGHILAPSIDARRSWTRRLADAIAEDRKCAMPDGSPLVVQSIRADSDADPVRTGQVQLAVRFGVIRATGDVPILARVTVGGDVSGEVT